MKPILVTILIISKLISSIKCIKFQSSLSHRKIQLRRTNTFCRYMSNQSSSSEKNLEEHAWNNAISKVAIIGSGIAGLGLMASLVKSSGVHEISIFESRNEEAVLQPQLGGGVQLSGGASVLERIGCYPELQKHGSPLSRILSRSNDGKVLVDIDVKKLFKKKASKELCANNGLGEPLMYSIMRATLLRILYNATQPFIENQTEKTPKCSIIGNKKCIEIMENNDGKVTLKFADGTYSDKFDLVVGADGISSTAIQFTSFGAANVLQKRSAKTKKEFRSSYSGIRIAYCITPPDSSLRLNGREAFHQWLGDGCYALAASYGGIQGLQHMLAIVYTDEKDARYGLNPEWSAEDTAEAVSLLRQRLNRAGLGNNPELESLLMAASADPKEGGERGRFFEFGVKDALLPLQKWSSDSGRVVLIGDSAHAMAPFLGQGANQALQDAYCLARLIGEHNLNPSSKVAEVAKKYEERRKIPTALLAVKSRLVGVVETLGNPVGMNFKLNFFRVLGLLGLAEEELLSAALPKY